MMRYGLCLLVLCLISSPARATDHIDGPVTKKTPVSDLSDLYVFPSKDKGSLAIIFNAYPVAPSGAHFSSKITYTIVIQKAEIKSDGKRSDFAFSDEMRIHCNFEDDHGDDHSVECASDDGFKAVTTRDKVTHAGGVKLFFGQRSDSFFTDADWLDKVALDGKLPPPTGKNTMDRLNVLTLAIELDRGAVFGGDFDLLAFVVETYAREEDGQVGRRMDRAGRSEITNSSLVAHGDEEDLRDRYNREDPLNVDKANAALYQARLLKNITKFYDPIDGIKDWDEPDADRFTHVLVNDYIVVDPDMPCDGDFYLEIERAMLASKPHETCGGRKPREDVIDKIYNLYINNEKREPIGDGVDHPFKPISDTFPYLAEPSDGPRSWIKTWIANREVKR